MALTPEDVLQKLREQAAELGFYPCAHCKSCYHTHVVGCPALAPRSALPGGQVQGKVPETLQAETDNE